MKKEIWRKNWLESFNKLTSFALQKNSWINITTGGFNWSFADFVSCYFEEVLFGFDYEFYIEEKFVSRKEYYIIKDWHFELSSYTPPKSDDYDNQAILSDQKWLSILDIGKLAKNKLMVVVPDNEKEFLKELSLPSYSPRW